MKEDSAMNRKRKPLNQSILNNDTPIPAKKCRGNFDDAKRRAGTISRIILRNFMCHSLLDVDVNQNVSIIIGRNGSGKSAILTALVVGLGGKASLTNRGSSIKGFIKAGRTSGSVEIELYNGGAMAYRPGVYGNKITVIRTITQSGGSYRIKAESGEVITTSAKELNNITASLNIQVDNPVCILNQDTSRNFLSSNDPKHKFTLFARATKLETLYEEYKEITSKKRETVRVLEGKKKNFDQLSDAFKKLKQKIDNHRSIVNIRDRVKMMHIELLWAQVREAAEEHRREELNVASLTKKHDKLHENCSTRVERIAAIKSTVASLRQQVAELQGTIDAQSRPQLAVKRQVEELRNTFNEKRREKHAITSAIEMRTRDIKILQKEISSANESMTRVEQEKMQRLRKLTSMEEKIKGMEDHVQTCKNDLYQIKSDTARKDEDKQHLRQEIIKIDHHISNDRSSLNALRNETGNTLLLYGRDIPAVKLAIEQNKHRFTQIPKGPLGSYIKLKDKKWAVAVEGFIGAALLNAFIVDNTKDNQLLREIFNQSLRSGRKPMIITSKFFHQKHDVSRHLTRGPDDCPCMYDVLEIEDAVVANAIVDQASVEGILLFPSNDMAMQMLSNRNNVPRNCHQGVTIKGDKYYPDPHYKTYGSRYHRATYLQVDTTEHMVQLQQNIKSWEEKRSTLQSQYSALNREVAEREASKSQLEEKIRKLNTARAEIRRALEELKATAEPEVANVQLLEAEMVEIKNVLTQKTAELTRVDEEAKEIKQSIIENEDKLKQLKAANSDLDGRIQLLDGEINENLIRQKELSTSDEFDKRQVRELQNQLNDARATMEEKKMVLDQCTEEASTLGERQETLRQIPDIAAEIAQLERSVRRIENDTESCEEVERKLQQLHGKLKNASAIMSNLNEDVKELNLAIEKRKRHYKLTEDYFVTYIKRSFKKIMEVRQFEAAMEIDLGEKKLELKVIPQQGSQGLTATSNLSGGERSFATVAFLYSLWQCMDFPFYFLDEFDVYMDKLNRTKVIDILLHHAKNHPTLQYVFLTPQDVSFINKDVPILRLEDPEQMNA